MIPDFALLCKVEVQKKMPNFPDKSHAPCIKKPNWIHFFSFFPLPQRDFPPPQGNFFLAHFEKFQKYLEFPSFVVYTIYVHSQSWFAGNFLFCFTRLRGAAAKWRSAAGKQRDFHIPPCAVNLSSVASANGGAGSFAALFLAFSVPLERSQTSKRCFRKGENNGSFY